MALGEAPAEAVRTGVRTARERGVLVCLDVNHRQRLWTARRARQTLAPLAPLLDLPPQVQSLLDCGVRQVVVKLGPGGARAHTAEGAMHLPARPVQAVNAIGAGDGFVAGYLSGLLDGLDVPGRLARAVAIGAFVVATAGDWEGLPTRDELALLDLQGGAVLR